ncbi:hypothetical protein [Falsihalocynthiibacter sp. CO-5D18]|uniref:hypothetical protein n=1 Tax=Falsihalocynthiibacter sp. CO-5D18 TaxID=3240872 RepID=UPI00351068E2
MYDDTAHYIKDALTAALSPFRERACAVRVETHWVSDDHIHIIALIDRAVVIDCRVDTSCGGAGDLVREILQKSQNDILVLARLVCIDNAPFHFAQSPAPELRLV